MGYLYLLVDHYKYLHPVRDAPRLKLCKGSYTTHRADGCYYVTHAL